MTKVKKVLKKDPVFGEIMEFSPRYILLLLGAIAVMYISVCGLILLLT